MHRVCLLDAVFGRRCIVDASSICRLIIVVFADDFAKSVVNVLSYLKTKLSLEHL